MYIHYIRTTVRNKNKLLLVSLFFVFNTHLLFSQDKVTLYGFIRERDSVPLIGTNVQITGTHIGSFSDLEGRYALKIPDSLSKFTVRLEYLGYKTKEFEFVRDSLPQQGIAIAPK